MTERARRSFWWTLFGLYAMVVFILSVIPVPEKIQPKIPSIDKIEHLVEYFFFGWLLMRAQFASGVGRTRAGWTATFAAIGFGVMCELIQIWIPYRSAEFMDLVADGIGGVLGTRLVNPRVSEPHHG